MLLPPSGHLLTYIVLYNIALAEKVNYKVIIKKAGDGIKEFYFKKVGALLLHQNKSNSFETTSSSMGYLMHFTSAPGNCPLGETTET